MLILTRRIGESVMIGDRVVVTITGVQGNKVRIGIEAPRSVPVHREEFFLRLRRDPGLVRSPDGASRASEARTKPPGLDVLSNPVEKGVASKVRGD